MRKIAEITNKIKKISAIPAIVLALLFSLQPNAIAQKEKVEKIEKLNYAWDDCPECACGAAFMYHGKGEVYSGKKGKKISALEMEEEKKWQENYIREKLKEWNENEKEAFYVCSLLAQEKYAKGIKKLDEFIEKYEKNYKKDGWFFPKTIMYFLYRKIEAILKLDRKEGKKDCLKTIEKMNQTLQAVSPKEMHVNSIKEWEEDIYLLKARCNAM